MAVKLTKNDIDKIIPPKPKNDAIKQTKRYEEEYEISKKEIEEIMERLSKLYEKINDDEKAKE